MAIKVTMTKQTVCQSQEVLIALKTVAVHTGETQDAITCRAIEQYLIAEGVCGPVLHSAPKLRVGALPHWSGSCGALLGPTPAAVGRNGSPIGRPLERKRGVRLPAARASVSAEVARPPFTRFEG